MSKSRRDGRGEIEGEKAVVVVFGQSWVSAELLKINSPRPV